jgi:hypothetical protein
LFFGFIGTIWISEKSSLFIRILIAKINGNVKQAILLKIQSLKTGIC